MNDTIRDCLIKRSCYFDAKNEYVKQAFAFGRKYVKHLLKYECLRQCNDEIEEIDDSNDMIPRQIKEIESWYRFLL